MEIYDENIIADYKKAARSSGGKQAYINYLYIKLYD